MMFLEILLVSIAVVAVPASPTNHTNVGARCHITKFNEVSSVVNNCTNIVVRNLLVDAGKTLELFLKSGATLTFEANTTFGYAEWEGPLISIRGENITVLGASGNRLDGRGAEWWDGKGDHGKKKPQFMLIQATGGSVMRNVHIYNCPYRCVGIYDSHNLTITNWVVDTTAGNPVNGTEVAHDTDGFDFAKSSNVVFDNVIVKNQGDCVCVNDGSNLIFKNMWCFGGNGLIISAGMNKTDYSRNVVSDVQFRNAHVIQSRNGIHIKSIADGGKGNISGLTFTSTQIYAISLYGINIEQNYRNNSGPSGDPNNNVPIENLVIDRVSGTMKGAESVPVYVLCASGGCTNFEWYLISIHGNSTPNSCTNMPSSGFNC